MSIDRAVRVTATLCAAVGMGVVGSGQAIASDLIPEGSFTMQGADDQKCLTELAMNTVGMEQCEEGKKSQQWTRGKMFSDGRFTVKSDGSSKCLVWVVPQGSSGDDPMYGMANCAEAARFSVESAGDGKVLIKEPNPDDASLTTLMVSSRGFALQEEVKYSNLPANQWRLTAVNP
ncbi:hypothetical protein [Nocardia sp. NPDC057030]|uniref:hypothetical protein n=1 Tax=unclassified Nocardia TaxID=2637762 RepID=UPI0036334DDC